MLFKSLRLKIIHIKKNKKSRPKEQLIYHQLQELSPDTLQPSTKNYFHLILQPMLGLWISS
jgi:hypothetical protein